MSVYAKNGFPMCYNIGFIEKRQCFRENQRKNSDHNIGTTSFWTTAKSVIYISVRMGSSIFAAFFVFALVDEENEGLGENPPPKSKLTLENFAFIS
jgi:hypothetical protein